MILMHLIEAFITSNLATTNVDSVVFKKSLKALQQGLGQPNGESANIFFSDTVWFNSWANATDFDTQRELVCDYIELELTILPYDLGVGAEGTLRAAILTFINDCPKVIDIEDNAYNITQSLHTLQIALGQNDGEYAAIFFSDDEWFNDWNDLKDYSFDNCIASKLMLVRSYIKSELGKLPYDLQ